MHVFAECQAINAYEDTAPDPAWPFLDETPDPAWPFLDDQGAARRKRIGR